MARSSFSSGTPYQPVWIATTPDGDWIMFDPHSSRGKETHDYWACLRAARAYAKAHQTPITVYKLPRSGKHQMANLINEQGEIIATGTGAKKARS